MASQTRVSAKASLSHEERTATEPRDKDLHSVILNEVTSVNSQINTYKFNIRDTQGLTFLPGQWLDVHCPGIPKAGGFTITSAPRSARPDPVDSEHTPYLELAVQKSPDNPPAAWLWQPPSTIIGQELLVRVGGSFVWPPPGLDPTTIKRAVFIAGGVGINPLISILTHIFSTPTPPTPQTTLLYTTRIPTLTSPPSQILFLPRLLTLFRGHRNSFLELFLTKTWDGHQLPPDCNLIRSLTSQPNQDRENYVPAIVWNSRLHEASLRGAVGIPEERGESVFFVCGPPRMTDEVVGVLRGVEGVREERVFCEIWW